MAPRWGRRTKRRYSYQPLDPKSTPRPIYSYQPLPGPEYIRILTLLPGRRRDIIKCTMEVILRADSEDTYEAISYVWGDATDRATIVCDGRYMEITTSLWSALRAIRDRNRPKRLWADAICIDQTEGIEKNHQVKNMGLVYSNAREVLVWLGEEEEHIVKDCFQHVRHANDFFSAEFGLEELPYLLPSKPSHQPFRNPASWSSFKRLVDNPWFGRLWVVQEVGLAKQCTLIWGTQRMDIANVMELSYWIVDMDIMRLQPSISPPAVGWLLNTFEVIQCHYRNTSTWRDKRPRIQQIYLSKRENWQPFTLILRTGRSLEASDPRDRIFAWLGLPQAHRQNGEPVIEPDYTKPVEEIYLEIAQTLLRNPKEAPWILCFTHHISQSAVDGSTLPSWCPRWDEQPIEHIIAHPNYWYHAGGPNAELEVQVNADKSICVKSALFDHLAWCSSALMGKDFEIEPARHSSNPSSVPFVDGLYHEIIQKIGGAREGLETEFSLTLIREYAGEKGPIDVQLHREYFDAYLGATRQANGTTHDSFEADDGKTNVIVTDMMQRLEWTHDTRLVVTRQGRLGLVPYFSQPGDMCAVLPGVSNPLILRKRDNGRYNLVGHCYIYGVLRGEVMEEIQEGRLELETIRIM